MKLIGFTSWHDDNYQIIEDFAEEDMADDEECVFPCLNDENANKKVAL